MHICRDERESHKERGRKSEKERGRGGLEGERAREKARNRDRWRHTQINERPREKRAGKTKCVSLGGEWIERAKGEGRALVTSLFVSILEHILGVAFRKPASQSWQGGERQKLCSSIMPASPGKTLT